MILWILVMHSAKNCANLAWSSTSAWKTVPNAAVVVSMAFPKTGPNVASMLMEAAPFIAFWTIWPNAKALRRTFPRSYANSSGFFRRLRSYIGSFDSRTAFRRGRKSVIPRPHKTKATAESNGPINQPRSLRPYSNVEGLWIPTIATPEIWPFLKCLMVWVAFKIRPCFAPPPAIYVGWSSSYDSW